jgi:hypothetical protein
MKYVVPGTPAICQWVADRIPGMDLGTGPISSIGLVDESGYLHAGIVYGMYTGNDIVLSIALLNKRSITRRFIEEGFKYPFLQLQCTRVTVMVARDNKASHAFVKRLGWKREGVLREWYQDGQDAIVYGMLRRECRWIHPRKRYGQHDAGQHGSNGRGNGDGWGRDDPALAGPDAGSGGSDRGSDAVPGSGSPGSRH